jgi:hypothetical protein
MGIPFVIDNQEYRLRDALNELLAQSAGKPLDIVMAYFAISGYRLMREGLHQVGAFRVILGAEPHSGADVGLRPNAEALKKRLQGMSRVDCSMWTWDSRKPTPASQKTGPKLGWGGREPGDVGRRGPGSGPRARPARRRSHACSG